MRSQRQQMLTLPCKAFNLNINKHTICIRLEWVISPLWSLKRKLNFKGKPTLESEKKTKFQRGHADKTAITYNNTALTSYNSILNPPLCSVYGPTNGSGWPN